jgi:type VI secretion system protein ImpK
MQEEIANLVHPILTYGLRLKERLDRGEAPLLEVEQAGLKGLLQSEIEARRWASYGGSERTDDQGDGRRGAFLGIRYALVCWLDELFTTGSAWEAQWNERKLEADLYGTNDRAWKFWEQAKLADTWSDGAPREAMYLCVMLGFCGELRNRPDQLRAWSTAAQARLAKELGREWAYPAELDPPTNVPPLHGREQLQRMVLVGGIALLLLIPLVAFLVVNHMGR